MNRETRGRGIVTPKGRWPRLSARILDVLEAVGRGLILLELSRRRQRVFLANGWEGIARVAAEEEQWALRRRIARLKRQGLIIAKRTGGRLILSLSDAGREALRFSAIRDAPPCRDGKRVFVIFDIPESQRRARDFLRHHLRSAGFTRIQQSVWMTDRDVAAELSAWVRYRALERWLMILLAEAPPGKQKRRLTRNPRP